MSSTRFDFVKYDAVSVETQQHFKRVYVSLANMIEGMPDGRAKAIALTKLEESFMWVGKALADDQIKSDAASIDHLEKKDG